MRKWIVAMTKPNCEAIAGTNLQRQGFISYCPRSLFKRPNKPPIIRPLFARYMFIAITDGWYSIKSTYGISRVLMADNGPCEIDPSVIDSLKDREDRKGLVQLAPKPKFLHGTAVRTNTGPLAGHLMLYEGMTTHDRVRVLVELLGRKVTVELEEKLLVAA